MNESQIKSSRVMISEWHQRSKGRSYCLSDLFWKYCQNSPFNFFFCPTCSCNRNDFLPQRIVWLCEAMYQSAFLSLEFRLNSVLVSSVAKPKFKKLVKNSRSTFIQIFASPISIGNKVFWLPGLIFSTTPPLFKRELPENARFWCRFKPLRAQNRKKIPKK